MAGTVRSVRTGCGAIALFFGVWLLSQAGGQGRVGLREARSAEPPPPGEQVEPAPDTPAVQDSGWHFALVRERPLEVRLKTAHKELQAGRLHEALTALHDVLVAPTDGLVQPVASVPPSSARMAAGRMLDGLTPEGRQLYSTLYEGEAARALAGNPRANELSRLEHVSERYFHTPTGGEACRRLANTWMDRGAFVISGGYWVKLWSDPIHRTALNESERLRALACLEATGQTTLAIEIRKSLAKEQVLLAGERVPLTEGTLRLARATADGGPIAVIGGLDRNASATGSPPMLDHPRWSTALAGEASRNVTDALAIWEQNQLSHALPLAVSNFAIVARPQSMLQRESGDVLLFRDYEGIRALDLNSHVERWHYRCESSLARDMAPGNGAVVPSPGVSDPGSLGRLFVGNRTLGMLACDGRLVYCVDELESRWNQPVNQFGQPVDIVQTGRNANALVAIELVGPNAGSARWIVGGLGRAALGRELSGYYFLGPPLPLAGRLYAVAEFRQELQLVCLDAETGALQWSRGLCLPTMPVENDVQRYYMACAPAFAEGLLICPTQSGVLMAAEPTTGAVRWAYSYDDAEQLERLSGWPNSSRQRYEQAGFANLPVVAQGKVLYLPAHSEMIHCVDLQSGRCCWKIRRDEVDQSTEYIGAATGDTVVVVGRRRCRGLALVDGRERWSYPLSGTPAGRGALLHRQYLVPLSNGQIACVDVETGRRIGFSLPNLDLRPGNLIVWKDEVLSLGRTELNAYPQAAAWLAKLPASSRSAAEELLAAELHLAIGDTASAKAELHSASGTTDAVTADRAQHLLREVLHCEFPDYESRQMAREEADTLDQLATLSHTPEQKARYLVRRIEFSKRTGDDATALAGLKELLSLNIDAPIALPDDAARSVDSSAWVRSLITSASNDHTRTLDGQLSELAVNESAAALGQRELPRLHRLTSAFADLPVAPALRLELAQRHWDEGRLHAAELQLLACRQTPSPEAQGTATRMLAELWSSAGLPHDSARMLRELSERFADIPVASGLTGREYLAGASPADLGMQALRRMSPPAWLNDGELPPRVSIRETRGANSKLDSAYHGNQVQFRAVPRGFAFDLLDKTPSSAGELVLIDRLHGGVLNSTVTLPKGYYYPVSVQSSFIGHVVPIGSPGCAHGVSLLDRRVVWSTIPKGLSGLSEVVRVGPAGPDYAVFQCRHHLFVLDPTDGRVLWHRQDVQANAGLMSDPYGGLFGDERVLVAFDADRAGYTVYDTPTGAELRRGRLDIDPRQTRRTFGRRLFHFSRSEEDRRLRLWDPLTDIMLWEEPADNLASSSVQAGLRPGTRVFAFVGDADELAYVTISGRLRVIDALTGSVRLDASIDAERLADLAFLRVFGDAERYFVNLQQITPTTVTITTNFTAQDMLIPAAHFQGDVLAFDRRTQERLWERNLGNRSFLQLPEFRLPVLFALCRVREGHQLTLETTVVDSRTGEILSSRDGLLADQILQYGYDRDSLTLALRGSRTEITVQLKPPLRATAEFDMPTIRR